MWDLEGHGAEDKVVREGEGVADTVPLVADEYVAHSHDVWMDL